MQFPTWSTDLSLSHYIGEKRLPRTSRQMLREERVPPGVPDTWCTCMVITAKKDGMPRRTVDLAALKKAGVRETHHTRSPFKVVCTVPTDTLKSTHCKDGYHSVSLAEEHRHKTTFITEQGRVRYTRAPQGYGSSNDGYTIRTDDILAKCPGKPDTQDYDKIVDDIILWSENLCNKSALNHTKPRVCYHMFWLPIVYFMK